MHVSKELLMTDKPKVSWNEVIGLEDAKRAMRESIVYPTIRPDLLPLGWARGILLFDLLVVERHYSQRQPQQKSRVIS